MKNLLTIILTAALLAVSGCTKYDDSALWDEVNSQAARIAALEAWQATVNSNITALQGLVNALQNYRYVTDVTTFTDPAPGGYTITFNTGTPVTIRNGANGEDGADGKDGTNGTNGTNGTDGSTPLLGVAKDTDNIYYWTLNGSWLLDGSGDQIPVTGAKGDKGEDGEDGKDGKKGDKGEDGKDGEKGKDGEDGTDGITPQLRINPNTNYWEICTNGACTEEEDWASTGTKATGDPGAAGAQGPQGDAIFAANGVNNANADYVVFTLAGGETTIQVPKYRELGISFTPPELFLPGETKTVGFTTTGNAAIVKVLDIPAGWTVAVARAGSAGTFTVTAPAAAVPSSEALVLISDDAGNVKMRSLTLPAVLYAASTQTWTFGGSTLTWSDAIRIPDCNKNSFTASDTEPDCRSYTDEGANTWYYYNWPYVIQNATVLCPSPWHVPTQSDFNTFKSNTTGSALGSEWGYGGFASGSSMSYPTYGYYCSSTEYSHNTSYAYRLEYSGVNLVVTFDLKPNGYQVRCVK
jgi:hypothetical protein